MCHSLTHSLTNFDGVCDCTLQGLFTYIIKSIVDDHCQFQMQPVSMDQMDALLMKFSSHSEICSNIPPAKRKS